MRGPPVIAVWFSCGAPSAVAAYITAKVYGEEFGAKVRVVNNPVAEEDPDNRRFLLDVQDWIGLPIESAVNSNYPDASAQTVWEHAKALSFPNGAPCTTRLKKHARQQWEAQNPVDYHVLGFTVEEQRRHDRFVLTERDNVIPVLIHEKLTREDCIRIISEAGIELPNVYKRGYPNANCIGCVKASSPTYWNHVRRDRPDVFAARADLSERFGAKLVRYKGERILLKDLPADATGRPLKSLDIPDCNIFCEEGRD